MQSPSCFNCLKLPPHGDSNSNQVAERCYGVCPKIETQIIVPTVQLQSMENEVQQGEEAAAGVPRRSIRKP